jgi:signal transduction histidine kinase
MDQLLQNLLRSVQRSDIKREPVTDIRKFLAEHAALFREQAGRRTITVGCPQRFATPVSFDKAQIGRALDNLILNAIQNSGDRAPIAVRVDIVGNELHLSVADAGNGVPPAIREHLFEPFATGRPDGTGLGLAIVREVAEAHGGRVTLEHRSDGTTFTLELPAGEQR